MKKIIVYFITSIIFVATLPISIVVFQVASMETFYDEPPPKYFSKWMNFVTSPFKLLR